MQHDLRLINEYLSSAERILEIGAGYGRVLEYILSNYPGSELHAIETSRRYSSLLSKKYNDKVTVMCGDVKTNKFTTQFDLALWMWSGICEFTLDERRRAFLNVLGALNEGGFLIIESFVPRESLAYDDCEFSLLNEVHKMLFEMGSLYGRAPSELEIMELSKAGYVAIFVKIIV